MLNVKMEKVVFNLFLNNSKYFIMYCLPIEDI